MSTVEITAKTVDEAKKLAAEKLGVAAGDVSVTVLEEVKGLFGKSTVRVSATVNEKPAKAAKAEKAEKPAKAAKGKAAAKVVEPAPEPVIEEEVVAVKPEKAAKPARGKAAAKPAAKAEEAPKAEEGEEVSDVIATEEDEAFIAELATGLLEAAKLDAHVSETSRSGKYVSVALDGRDVAHLVGKHGEVLNALQYLMNVMITQQRKNGVRATLDGGDYRRQREEALTKLATKIAGEVVRRQQEAVLDALPAFERRIVHKALSVIEGISTYSEGEEPNRRVVIAPAE